MALLQAGTGSLEEWVLAQRWYAGKGRAPRLREIGSWQLPGDQETEARVALLLDESATPAELYQVPLTLRATRLPDLDSALIGTVRSEDGSERFLYDGMHDRLFARQLLELIVKGERADGDHASAAGVPLGTLELAESISEVVSGEQSNTSVVFRFERKNLPQEQSRATFAFSDPNPDPAREHGTRFTDLTAAARPHAVVCKLFRILHAGVNPDVELQSALTAAGSLRVPETIGSIVGQWPDHNSPGSEAFGHLAFAQVFVEGARDAWALALAAARTGQDFSEFAEEIGRATAEIHRSLASTLQTKRSTHSEVRTIEARWHQRLTSAIAEIPVIEEFERSIARVYDTAAAVEWPDLQRIHGDLHLGQVLITPGGRCVIIDFEGEPIRPIIERAQPDLALRDVAGMLRSFDYVKGALPDVPGIAEWTHSARRAFLDGYILSSGDNLRAHRELLDAFEMDKAVYEAVYESRHRPTWLPIPTEAIARLAGRGERQAGADSPEPAAEH
ncbi:MAG TPA: phosphotransferase [Nitrolancea sp.]|nr:phosphotransferase [Nitrolancea sp.]